MDSISSSEVPMSKGEEVKAQGIIKSRSEVVQPSEPASPNLSPRQRERVDHLDEGQTEFIMTLSSPSSNPTEKIGAQSSMSKQRSSRHSTTLFADMMMFQHALKETSNWAKVYEAEMKQCQDLITRLHSEYYHELLHFMND